MKKRDFVTSQKLFMQSDDWWWKKGHWWNLIHYFGNNWGRPQQQCCVYDLTSADVCPQIVRATADKLQSIMRVQLTVAVGDFYWSNMEGSGIEMEAAAAIGHQDRGAWGWSAEAKILRVYIYFFSVFVLVKNKPSWKEVKVRKNN